MAADFTLTVDHRRAIGERAQNDAAFAERLRTTPHACIAEMTGARIPESTTVRVVENTATRMHNIIPAVPDGVSREPGHPSCDPGCRTEVPQPQASQHVEKPKVDSGTSPDESRTVRRMGRVKALQSMPLNPTGR